MTLDKSYSVTNQNKKAKLKSVENSK